MGVVITLSIGSMVAITVVAVASVTLPALVRMLIDVDVVFVIANLSVFMPMVVIVSAIRTMLFLPIALAIGVVALTASLIAIAVAHVTATISSSASIEGSWSRRAIVSAAFQVPIVSSSVITGGMSLRARIALPILLELGEAPRLALAPENVVEGAILDILIVASLEVCLQGLGVLFYLFVLHASEHNDLGDASADG